jgi:uncharacterized protein (TIGR04255 family)
MAAVGVATSRARVEGPKLSVDFRDPPLVEVALGVQFKPLLGLRAIELGVLRDRWREEYPTIQEQPPLPPTVETEPLSAPVVQITVGPALQSRLWFLSEDETELVQLQHDRLNVNWRRLSQDQTYPHYPAVRDRFVQRFRDLASIVSERHLGELLISQVELNYINVVPRALERLGRIDELLAHWQPLTSHHLGAPEQARVGMVFRVPEIGREPVRLHVSVDPGQHPPGRSALLVTLTVRGAPAGPDVDAALAFMDDAHAHTVRSFIELTSGEAQHEWGRIG